MKVGILVRSHVGRAGDHQVHRPIPPRKVARVATAGLGIQLAGSRLFRQEFPEAAIPPLHGRGVAAQERKRVGHTVGQLALVARRLATAHEPERGGLQAVGESAAQEIPHTHITHVFDRRQDDAQPALLLSRKPPVQPFVLRGQERLRQSEKAVPLAFERGEAGEELPERRGEVLRFQWPRLRPRRDDRRHVDVDAGRAPASHQGLDQGRPGTHEGIEHQLARLGIVANEPRGELGNELGRVAVVAVGDVAGLGRAAMVERPGRVGWQFRESAGKRSAHWTLQAPKTWRMNWRLRR